MVYTFFVLNFYFTGLLQVYLASELLRRPIKQFCLLAGADHYRARVEPFERQSDDGSIACLDILWIPLTLRDGEKNNFNHIVPLLPWKCGAAPYKLCLFSGDMNADFSNLKSDFAQCDVCQEWYHTCCLGLSLRLINRMEHFSCGCDVLPGDGSRVTKNA